MFEKRRAATAVVAGLNSASGYGSPLSPLFIATTVCSVCSVLISSARLLASGFAAPGGLLEAYGSASAARRSSSARCMSRTAWALASRRAVRRLGGGGGDVLKALSPPTPPP